MLRAVPVADATTATRDRYGGFHQVGYELFIYGLSVFSILNIVFLVLPIDAEAKQVVTIVDSLLCLVFITDFAYRLIVARDRRAYMRVGWADFLGSLPIPGFRLFRLIRIRLSTLTMQAAGGRSVLRQLIRDRGGTAFVAVLLIAIVVLEITSMLMVVVEASAPNGNIKTGGDSLWWAFVSVTTVGYGDYYPVTPAGRFIGSLLLAVGIGLFSTITGFLATRLTTRPGDLEPLPVPPAETAATAGPEDGPAIGGAS